MVSESVLSNTNTKFVRQVHYAGLGHLFLATREPGIFWQIIGFFKKNLRVVKGSQITAHYFLPLRLPFILLPRDDISFSPRAYTCREGAPTPNTMALPVSIWEGGGGSDNGKRKHLETEGAQRDSEREIFSAGTCFLPNHAFILWKTRFLPVGRPGWLPLLSACQLIISKQCVTVWLHKREEVGLPSTKQGRNGYQWGQSAQVPVWMRLSGSRRVKRKVELAEPRNTAWTVQPSRCEYLKKQAAQRGWG